MRLKILLPSEIFVDEDVSKIVAEGANGSFCLLPRHVDFCSALVPGLLSFQSAGGGEATVAINTGTLVKQGADVLVSTRNAFRATELEKLKQTVERQYQILDDREKMARSASARLEASLVRRFLEFK